MYLLTYSLIHSSTEHIRRTQMDSNFQNIAKTIIRTRLTRGSVFKRRFKANFGVSLNVFREIWTLIRDKNEYNIQRHHLMWALFFLKVYAIENVMHTVLIKDEKTLRKWTKTTAYFFSKLSMVKLTFFLILKRASII